MSKVNRVKKALRPGVSALAVLAVVAAGTLGPTPAIPDAGAVTKPTALRGSIVYVKADNVWIAKADGTRARALTRNGTKKAPYRTPTQDDRGNVYALRGGGIKAKIVHLDQFGHVLAAYAPPINSVATGYASVAPDGKKLAYGTMFATSDCSFSPCHTIFQHTLEYADPVRGKVLRGAHAVPNVDFASWAGNNRTVLQTRVRNTVLVHRPGATKPVEWFTSCRSYDAGCEDTEVMNFAPAVNRSGTRLATSLVTDRNGDHDAYLAVLATADAVTANPPPEPGAGCVYALREPTADFPSNDDIGAASWSPDGSALVFAQRAGTTWTTMLLRPNLSDCAATDPVALIKGASQPHWSKAELAPPALIWTGKLPAVKGTAKVGSVVKVSLSVTKLRKAFSPRATKVRLQWLRNGRPIKNATKAAYTLRQVDRGKRIAIDVTGIRKGYTATFVVSPARKIK